MAATRKRPVSSFAAALAVLILSVGAAPTAPLVAVRAARLLDLDRGALRNDAVVLVRGDRIVSVRLGVRVAPREASIVDLGPATLVPGLIDAHVHLSLGAAGATARDNARSTLEAGFTTVQDLGATGSVVFDLRRAVEQGEVPGPRIVAAGEWIGETGGTCDFGGIGTAGAAGFAARALANLTKGADVIKVCVTGWPQAAFDRPDDVEISRLELQAATAAAHARRRRVVAHAIGRAGVKLAIDGGVDALAHAAFLDAESIDAMRRRGIVLIPTLRSFSRLPSPVREALRDRVRDAHRAGVAIAFGTDAGVIPHGRNAVEFGELVGAGLDARDAIRTATIGGAAALGLQGTIGAIRAGALADIVGVDGDPLQDVGALGRVRFVMKSGRVAVLKR